MKRSIGLLVCAWASSGCASSLYPRAADTTPAKHWSIEMASPIFALAANEARIRKPTGDEYGFRGVGGSIDELGGPMPTFVPEFTGRFGLTERLEIGAIAGPLRLAAETRFGIVAERRGNPLSIAVAAAAGYQPFYGRTGPWLRGGIDISRRTRSLLVMTNLHVTYGSEAHAMILNLPPRPEDATTADGAPQHAQVTQREIRFLPALAFGMPLPEGNLFVGAVPWFVVRAWAPERMECDGCLSGYRVTDFRETFGVSLVLGGAFRRGF